MALSRGAARTARDRRWLWAFTACGGAAGIVVVENQLRELAQANGQTTVEYTQERAVEAVANLRQTSSVAGALFHTAATSVLEALKQRRLDPGPIQEALATTLADLAADPIARRHLLAWGGGPLLDWLLDAAFPDAPGRVAAALAVAGDGVHDRVDAGSTGRGNDGGALRPSHRTAGVDWAGIHGSDVGGSGQGGRGDVVAWGRSGGQFSLEAPVALAGREPQRLGAAGDWPAAAGGGGFAEEDERDAGRLPALDAADAAVGVGDAAAAADAAVLVRRSRAAQRALQSLLDDDSAARALLSRPGAAPRLLRAVAGGRAGSGLVAALSRRGAGAKVADEAMTADLMQVLEVLRGRVPGGVPGGAAAGAPEGADAASPQLQRLACGLLAAWAAGSAANRAKLTGLGLQAAVAELMAAVSGLGDRAAWELQWELLRLARIMAEHSSSSDAHHLAACIMPLLYTAADAAAAYDAAMASYTVDTLAAAARNGGAPVSEQIAASTLPYLLWQLADGMASYKAQPLVPPSAPAGQGGGTGGKPVAKSAAKGGRAGAPAAASGPAAAAAAAATVAASGAQAGGNGAAGPAAGATGTGSGAAARRATAPVWTIRDPALVAAIAAAVSELAHAALLPEAQVPRWRDWLLDVLCGEGLEPAPADLMTAAPAGAVAAGGDGSGGSGNSNRSSTAGRVAATGFAPAENRAPATREDAGNRYGDGAHLAPPRRLPSWLSLPTDTWSDAAAAGGSGSGGRSAVAGAGRGRGRCRGRAAEASVGGRVCAGGQPRGQERERQLEVLRGSVIAALSALSQMPGNHGLQAAHYWLSRLLSELAARTLPYTSLVYAEGPRDPQDLVHCVPVLPSYVRTVADALERAADAVAEDAPPMPPLLEFELAGSGLVGRAPHSLEAARLAAAEAYRRAAHVVDVVVAERKAADALEALCAIVAPDPVKQRWLLRRGVLPLLHRLTRTADDPRVTLPEQGQPGAEQEEAHQAVAEAAAEVAAASSGSSGAAVHVNRSAQPGADGSKGSPAACQPPAHPPHSPREPTGWWRLYAPSTAATAGTRREPRPGSEAAAAANAEPGTAAAPGNPAAATAASPVVVSEVLSDHQGGPSLCLQRQVARMLALLALLPEAQASIAGVGGAGAGAEGSTASALTSTAGGQNGEGEGGGEGWAAWLRHAATSSDCRLSSNATRALLHSAAVSAGAAAPAMTTAAASAPAASAMPTGGPAAAPVFLDGIHLLDPGASHHWVLVQQAAAAVAAVAEAAATATAAVELAAVAAEARPAGAVLGGSSAGATPAGVAVSQAEAGGRASSPHSNVRRTYGSQSETTAEVLEFAEVATMGSLYGREGGRAAWTGPPADPGLETVLAETQVRPEMPYLPSSPPPSMVTRMYDTLSYTLYRPWLLLRDAAAGLAGAGVAAMGGGGSGAAAVAPTLSGDRPMSVSRAEPSPPPSPPPAPASAPAPAPAPAPVNAVAASGATAAHSGSSLAPVVASSTMPGGLQQMAAAAAVAPPIVRQGAGARSSGSMMTPTALSPPPQAPPPQPTTPSIAPYPAPYPPDYAADYAPTRNSPEPAVTTTAEAVADANADAPPSVDVVFIHGIRGGPFITWRKAGVMTRGSAASHMERSACWPSTWLAEDFPRARLLSVEYLAPVSAWEGESLPLEDNVSRVMGQLAAAGVGTGQRPVVFVAHSMGGLLVKEMLARSVDQSESGGGPLSSLAASTAGIVFFGTPHFGNTMAAMGWKLRHLPGAHPAPSLARLTPGPHLLALNDCLRELHDSRAGGLVVVSMLEGLPTQLAGGVIPRITVVPPDSAYPGFGAAMVLPQNDHIDCCKPAGKDAPAYKVVRDVVRHAVEKAGGRGEKAVPGDEDVAVQVAG